MRSLLPVVVVGAAALALAFAPAAAATAATPTTVAPHYTLRISGDGGHATVGYIAMTFSSSSSSPSNPESGTIRSAHEPWWKQISTKSNFVEVFAMQKTGTSLSCTITDPKGKVVSRSTASGAGAIVTCIVARGAALSMSGL